MRNKSFFKKRRFLFLPLLFIIVLIIIFRPTKQTASLIPPTDKTIVSNFETETIGFFPYWNLSRLEKITLPALSQIYFFALTPTIEGSIDKSNTNWRNFSSMNFNRLKERATLVNSQLGISIASNNEEIISALAANPNSARLLGVEIGNLLKTNGLSGVNIDLEYSGGFDKELKSGFDKFLSLLVSQIKKDSPESLISIAVYPDSFLRPTLYDPAKVAAYFDRIIIMGYDLSRLDSVRAGPTSPLDLTKVDNKDLSAILSDFKKIVPQEKIIVALPLYGYDWPTVDATKNSFTINSSSPAKAVPLRQIYIQFESAPSLVSFDRSSAWFSYFDPSSNTFRQVWFDNEISLNTKCRYLLESGIRGIGFFALGYEPADKNFWESLTACLSSKSDIAN